MKRNRISPGSALLGPSSSGANNSVAESANTGPQKLHDDESDVENGQSTTYELAQTDTMKQHKTENQFKLFKLFHSCFNPFVSIWLKMIGYFCSWKPFNVLKLLFGLIMHLWDSWSDVVMTITYIQDNNTVWFSLSTVIVVLSQFQAAHHAYTFQSKSGKTLVRRVLFGLLGFLNLHIFWDFGVLAIKLKGDLNHPTALKTQKFFEQTRFSESMLEALPQVLLQLYVFLITGLEIEWSVQKAIAVMSICTSLVTVSLGLYECIPSRVGALCWWNKVLVFLFTFVGTVARTLFWVLLAHEIHGAVFGVAAGMWVWCAIIRAIGRKLPANRSEFLFFLLHAARDVLIVSPFTLAKSLLSVKKRQKAVVILSQGAAQVSFGVWFCFFTIWNNSAALVLGWSLVGAACLNMVLGLYQLHLFSKSVSISTKWSMIIKAGNCKDEPLPGEVDANFVQTEGDETLLMLAARKKHVEMLRNLLLREADVLACCADGCIALGKSADFECSKVLVDFMLANYPFPYLAENNLLVWQINKSFLTKEEKKRISMFALSQVDLVATRQFYDFDTDTIVFKTRTSNQRALRARVLVEGVKLAESKITTLTVSSIDSIGSAGARALAEAITLGTCSITTLNLHDNKIGVDGTIALAEAVKTNFSNITTLCISFNGIGVDGARAVAEAVKLGTCKITILDISENDIGDDGAVALAEAMKSHTCNITSLNICDNDIQAVGARALSDALKLDTCKVTGLFISDNPTGDDGANAFAQALMLDTCKITTLAMSDNGIGSDGARALAEALKLDTCNLTDLDISWNSIGLNGATTLSEAVKLSKVITLDVSGNEIGANGVNALAEAFKSVKCQITTINISANGIGDDGARAISEAVKLDTCKITTLDISKNDIGPDGATALAKVVKMGNITTLNLHNNQIGADGARSLVEAVKLDTCKISTLNISKNQIGDNGANALAEALRSHTCNITSLNICENGIQASGAKALSDAVKLGTCKVTSLFIGTNQIGNDGAKALAEAVKLDTCKIATLDISYNRIGNDGIGPLAEAFKLGTCNITTIDISGNRIDADGARALAEAVKLDTCKIVTLKIAVNVIGSAGANALVEAVNLDTCKITTLNICSNAIQDKSDIISCRRRVNIDL